MIHGQNATIAPYDDAPASPGFAAARAAAAQIAAGRGA